VNVTLLTLIGIDIGVLAFKLIQYEAKPFSLAESSIEKKPNVYFFLLDEYAGFKQLEKEFQFDNQDFADRLRAKGFTVSMESRSNYKDTPFSMASLLSMSYLDLNHFTYTDSNLNYCYRKIYNSRVVEGFQSVGYEFINHSIFDFKNKSTNIDKTFLKSGIDLISAQTLGSRLYRDVYNNLIYNHFQNTKLYSDLVYTDFRNNEKLFELTKAIIRENTVKPRFVYTHLLMPHFPYYFNEEGKINAVNQLSPDKLNDKSLYLGYLKYSTSRILHLLNEIEIHDKNAIVVLLSDHGFRYGKNSEVFSNLSAIYVPGQ
jgi:hypothetical protein